VNGPTTGLAEADLEEAFVAGVQAVCLPKAETPTGVVWLAGLLGELEGRPGRPDGPVGVFLMIETALGVLNAYALAKASPRVRGLCLGGEDLARDLGAIRTRDGAEIALARAQMVLAARAAGAMGIDTIFTDLGDLDGLLAEARTARQMGYGGKLIVHPSQIGPVRRAFAPSEPEIAYARRVLAAFEAAEARGQGVIALDGQMIDAPVVARAREIVAAAEESEP
jgi:citrate lyase subunit beta/citryl-CoA lyase